MYHLFLWRQGMDWNAIAAALSNQQQPNPQRERLFCVSFYSSERIYVAVLETLFLYGCTER